MWPKVKPGVLLAFPDWSQVPAFTLLGMAHAHSLVCRAQSTCSLRPPLMALPIPPSASFWPISSPSDPSSAHLCPPTPGPALQTCCQGGAVGAGPCVALGCVQSLPLSDTQGELQLS